MMKSATNKTQNADLRPLVRSLLRETEPLLLMDQRIIRRKIHQLPDAKDTSGAISDIRARIERAQKRSLVRCAESLHFTYPENLPLSSQQDEILAAWRKSPVIVVCGSTGSGKTTQLPKIALELGGGRLGMIGCTQPRRLAATAMARRVAGELNVEYGREVGSQVRFDDRTSENTVVKFMTDGILLAETANDPDFLRYDTLIIDEVHERSLNIDFLLGYLKQLLDRRHNLRIAISSATLDAEQFSQFFNDAPIVMVEGRTYPVEDVFFPPEEDEELSAHIGRAVGMISEIDRDGDILVFLPGEREIRDAADLLTGRKIPGTEILPLYARLSAGDQQKIFSPGGGRRIILATNVAETSVTIPRIHYVIDSGLARISRYQPRLQVQELQIEQISKASARQRRGRCGRIGEGICVYLYSEEDMQRAPDYTDPEIKRTSLAGVILQMAMLKLPRIDRFPLLDPPSGNLIREGIRTLEDLCALTPDGKITKDGWKIAALPIDPHLAKMMVTANQYKVLPEVMAIVGFLSVFDPRERPADQQQAADQAHRAWKNEESDFLAILNLWNFLHGELGKGISNSAFRKLCRKNFLNYNRVNEWFNLSNDLRDSAQDFRWDVPRSLMTMQFENTPYDLLHMALLSGLPRNIGMYDKENNVFLGTGGKKFHLFPASYLFKRKPLPAWTMSFALVDTTRLFARQNAEIKPELLARVAPHLCKPVYDNVQYDPASGFVYARERLLFGGLVIQPGKRVHYGKIDPAASREVLIREGLATGNFRSNNPALTGLQDLLDRLRMLEVKIRRPGTVLDTTALAGYYLDTLPPGITSIKELEEAMRGDKTLFAKFIPPDSAAMQEQYRPLLASDYPDRLPGTGPKFKLHYAFEPGEKDDGICVMVPGDQMNMLSANRLDYIVPGYLEEKVELLIKTLPKELRIAANPVADSVLAFLIALEDGKSRMELPLVESLAEFLTERTGKTVRGSDFDQERLPRYLFIKIAELNKSGQIVRIHEELPDAVRTGSRLSAAVRGAGGWSVHNLAEFPPEEMPESVPLPEDKERQAFVALTAEEDGSVSRSLFLDENEASFRQASGVIQLFRTQEAGLVKFIKRDFKIPNAMKLDWFARDPEKRHIEDLTDWTIRRAFDCDLWKIRSGEAYKKAREHAKENLGKAAQECMAQLLQLHKTYDEIDGVRQKIKERNGTLLEDFDRQLKFLFRNGFMRCTEAMERYPRYLKGALLRVGRINSAPQKDAQKLEPIEGLLDRFYLAAMAVDPLDRKPALVRFFLALEELRLAQFAPEVRLMEKVSVPKVQQLWDDLRL